MAASGGGFGVGRVTSEFFLACDFAVTGLGILVMRVSPSLEDHRIAAELPVRWVPLGKIGACVTRGRVTGSAELRGSAADFPNASLSKATCPTTPGHGRRTRQKIGWLCLRRSLRTSLMSLSPGIGHTDFSQISRLEISLSEVLLVAHQVPVEE